MRSHNGLNIFLILMLAISTLASPSVFAQGAASDGAPPAATETDDDESDAPAASEALSGAAIAEEESFTPAGEEAAQAPAPQQAEAPRTTAQQQRASPVPRFGRSRLTNDRTESRSDRRKLLLSTGEDKLVDLDFEANLSANGISVGNPKVVATTLVRVGEKRQIVFKPLSAGETTVTVRDGDGNVQVIFEIDVAPSNLVKVAEQLQELFKDIEGLNIRVVGQKVILDGEVLVPNDYGRMLNVIQDGAYKDLVLNLTSLSGIALQILSKKIQQDINVFAPNVRTRVVNGQVWLEGTVDNFDQARRSALLARLYLPDLRPGSALERDPNVQRLPPRSLVQNFIVINPPPPKKQEKLVRVTVHFVELKKDYSKVFGFKWQPGFTADPQITIGTTAEGGTGAQGGTSFTATISSLFPKLQSASNAGYARILKSGTVIVRSGQPAKLVDKTVIPFPVVGPNGQVTTNTAGVGLQVSVTPSILGQSEDIQMDLKMEQVNLTGQAGTAPITAEHTVETKIYVKSRESAAIAGLQSTDVKTTFNKDDPNQGGFTGQTSPLFTLLRSKNYQKDKRQFVIFVTPQIIENASEGTDDLKKNFRVKASAR